MFGTGTPSAADLPCAGGGRPLDGVAPVAGAVRLPHVAEVTRAAFSADGRLLATGDREGVVRIWRDGVELWRAEHDRPIVALQFGPGETLLAAGRFGKARLWNWSDETVEGEPFQPRFLLSAALSTEGRLLVAGAAGGAWVWSLPSRAEESLEHDLAVYSVAVAPDGTRVATGDAAGAVRLWTRGESGWQAKELAGEHDDRVTQIGFSLDGSRLFSFDRKGTAVVRRLADGSFSRWTSPEPDEPWLAAAFSADGKRLLVTSGDGTGELVDLTTVDAPPVELAEALDGSPKSVAALAPAGERALIAFGPMVSVETLAIAASELPTEEFVRQGANRPQLAIETGSTTIRTVAVSEDGRLLLTGAEDGALRLWQAEPLAELRRLEGHSGAILDAVFSRQGRHALTGSADGSARLWDLATGNEVRRFEPKFDVLSPMSAGAVLSVAISDDGCRVLTGGREDVQVRLWDVSSGRELRRFRGHEDSIRAVGFVRGEPERVVSSSRDGTARIWSMDGARVGTTLAGEREASSGGGTTSSGDGETLRTVTGNPDNHRRPVVFSARGDWLLRGWNTGRLELVEVPSGEVLRRFAGHEDAVAAVALSPDGSIAASVGEDGSAKVWSTASGERLGRYSTDGAKAAALLPIAGGAVLVTAGAGGVGTVRSLADGDELARLGETPNRVKALAIARSGDPILFGGGSRVWSWSTTGSRGRSFDVGDAEVTAVGLSADGGRAVAGDSEGLVRVWSTASGVEVARFEHEEEVIGVATLPPDRVVVATGDGVVRLWSPGSALPERTFDASADTVLRGTATLAFDLCSTGQLVTGGAGGTLRLWSIETGAIEARFRETTSGSVLSVACAPDGRTLAASSGDGVRLWAVDSKVPLRRFQAPGGAAEFASSVRYAPDGRTLLIGGATGDAYLVSPEGRLLERFEGSGGAPAAARFTPDGRWVVTGHHDGVSRLWSTAGGVEAARWVVYPGGNWALAAPDGRFDTDDLEAVRGLNWVLPEDPLRALPLEIFMRDYFEPRLFSRLLARERLPPVPDLAELNRLQPQLALEAMPQQGDGRPELRVTVEVVPTVGDDGDSGARDLHLFRDGQLVGMIEGDLLSASGSGTHTFADVSIPLDGRRQTELSAYAFNRDGVKSETARFLHPLPEELPRRRGRAYVVAIGVDRYEDPQWRELSFASHDARATAAALTGSLESLGDYSEVVSIELVSTAEEATATRDLVQGMIDLLAGRRTGLERRLLEAVPAAARLGEVEPEDLVLLSFAGHGSTDEAGVFHLQLRDGPVSSDDLSVWLRDVDAGSLALVIDACQSAASVEEEGFKPGPMGSRGLGQLSYNKGMPILAASQADDVALEFANLKHGLLTYALIREGLEGALADRRPRDRSISLAEWLSWGVERVPSLAEEARRGVVDVARWRGSELVSGRRPVVAQQPALFDFRRRRDPVPLARAGNE